MDSDFVDILSDYLERAFSACIIYRGSYFKLFNHLEDFLSILYQARVKETHV